MAEKEEEEVEGEEEEEAEEEGTEEEEEGEEEEIEGTEGEEEDEEVAEDEFDDDTILDDANDSPETLRRKNVWLYERTKRAEGFVKQKDGTWLKKKEPKAAPKPKPEAESKNNSEAVDPDELRLIAQGYPDEVIAKAKVIAKGEEISLLEAIKDPLVKSFHKDLKEKEKRRKAKLGASRGSGQGEADESPFKPGMTKDQHKKAWNAATGKK